MKIISLNAKGGVYFEPLMRFVLEHAESTDVFCFQEMLSNPCSVIESRGARANLYQELSSRLLYHKGKFAPAITGYDLQGEVGFTLSLGLATFVRADLRFESRGDIFVSGSRHFRTEGLEKTQQNMRFVSRNLQHATFGFNGGVYSVAHFHGLYTGQGKVDTPGRIKQSLNVRRILDELPGHKISCGDWNLNPDTESLKILEDGMVNLIRNYGVTDTRGKLYLKPERYADYMLVSPGLEKRIKSFEVPDLGISDHLPLILELED